MSRIKPREIDGEQTAFALTRPATTTLVDVFVSPDEVFLSVLKPEQYLTPVEARSLAASLVAAADMSERVDFVDSDDPDGLPKMFLYATAADRPE